MNALLTTRTFTHGFHLGKPEAAVGSPSSTLHFQEEAAPDHPQLSSNGGNFDPSNDQITRRHRDSPNFAFCDGHVNYSRRTVIPYPLPAGDPRFEP